jgi:hypothetical protein
MDMSYIPRNDSKNQFRNILIIVLTISATDDDESLHASDFNIEGDGTGEKNSLRCLLNLTRSSYSSRYNSF